MDKKKFKEKDFMELINSETIAFYSYDLIVRNKIKGEYVDIIADTWCSFTDDLKKYVPLFYRAKVILERDYNVDMYSLPFKQKYIIEEIKSYEKEKQLEKYFDENNIKYKKDYVYFKALELLNTDENVKKIIDEINEINSRKEQLENDKKVPI